MKLDFLNILHPDDRIIFVGNALCLFHPFSESELNKLSNQNDLNSFINWECISKNVNIKWTVAGIDRFRNYLDFSLLSQNESLPWTEELVSNFEKKWDWEHLSQNTALPWSSNFINAYLEKWKWKPRGLMDSFTLARNEGIEWSSNLIEEFVDLIDWDGLSLNESMAITSDLIKKYDDKWNWSFLSLNKALPWTDELYNSFKNKWDWRFLSRNDSLPWTYDFVIKNLPKIDFKSFSRNKKFQWTQEFIVKYQNDLDWAELAGNPALPWSELFVLQWKDKLSFSNYSFLVNQNLFWTNLLLDTLKDKIDWQSNCSYIQIEDINHFIKHHMNISNQVWSEISKNENNLFTKQLLQDYASHWVWYSIKNEYRDFGEGLSGNPGVYKYIFKDVSLEDIEQFISDCKIEINSPTLNHNSYVQIHKEIEDEINFQEQCRNDEYEDTTDYNSFWYDPNFDHESDLDQQGPDFDF